MFLFATSSLKKAFLRSVYSLAGFIISISFLGNLSSCDSAQYDSYVTAYADSLPKEVDYNIHIRPILSDRCFNCHGPDAAKRKANLRLDVAEDAYNGKTASGRKAIVPNSLSKSEAFLRIISDDPHSKMPTPESNMSLSPKEIALIGKWIKEGAVYKPLWSLTPIVNYSVPKGLKSPKWVQNPIDAFILQSMEQQGLEPNPEADKATLIQRLTTDLTGLAASPDEVQNFLSDQSPNAYEKVVDRLLASPHYGEKLAYEWVDVARYADSHGYQDDGFRNAWHWREWVINAFNQNLPFNKFIQWQLAGDLLPNPTKEMMIATGFNRNHQQNQEGGIVPEEYRVEYVLDRTNTVGKAFLGLTVECSRCHDHKYDPISQKEYFSLSAFFNQLDEAGQIPNYGHPQPTYQIASPEAASKIEALKKQYQNKQEEEKLIHQQEKAQYANWKKGILSQPNPYQTILNTGLQAYFPLEKIDSAKHFREDVKAIQGALFNAANPNLKGYGNQLKIVKGSKGNAVTTLTEQNPYFPLMANFDRFDPFTIGAYFKVTQFDKSGGVFFSNAKEIYDGFNGYTCHYNPDSTISFRFVNQFPANTIQATTKSKVPLNKWFHLMVRYTANSKAKDINIFINGKSQDLKIDYDQLTRATDKHVDNIDTIPEGNRQVFDRSKRRLRQYLLFMAMRQYQYPALKGELDEVRIYQRALSNEEISAIVQLDQDGGKLPPLPQNELWWQNLYLQIGSTKAMAVTLAKQHALYVWDTTQSGLPEVMVMKDRPQLRPTFVLDRGAYDSPTDEVLMGTPKAIADFTNKYPKNRLGLSQWLLEPTNPLTARVLVNRYWQLIFGKGLVSTPGDFGNQGEMPTHPELLDYLSYQFIHQGWDLKAMVKQMVMSNTYRQSSYLQPEKFQKDPHNKYYARANRYRLPFEIIRDKALQVSGLLVPKIGGPSVFPYQPPGLWEEKTSGRHLPKYPQSKGEGLYRRSLYTFFKRTSPPPTFQTFDASDRNNCFVKREQTNTPLQSLVTLNDIQFQEAARVFAANLISATPNATPERWLSTAFKQLLGQEPTSAELQSLTNLYQKALSKYKAAPQQANMVISAGEWPVYRQVEPATQAALSVSILTLFNTDKALNRN